GVDTWVVGIDVSEAVESPDLAQEDRLIQRSLASEDEVRFDLMLRAIQFVCAHLTVGDPAQLVVDTGLDFLDRMIPASLGTDVKECWIFRFSVLGGNERHRLLALHQTLIQPRRLSFGKQNAKQLQSVAVRMRGLGCLIRNGEPRY